MKPRFSADNWLALCLLTAALLIVFVWVPLDTDTGIVESVRRKFVIGDALGPTIAGAVVAIGALLTFSQSPQSKSLSLGNLSWIIRLSCLFVVSLVAMRFAGPIAAAWTEGGYRPLRATPPWNYVGFLLGGTIMVGGLTALATRRIAWRDFVTGFAAALVIALLYDVPFDDLILPPNGDV